MSPWFLVTPCLGPDTLAGLCAACDAASEGECGEPGTALGFLGGPGALEGVTPESPGPLALGIPQEQDEERDGGRGEGLVWGLVKGGAKAKLCLRHGKCGR